MSRNGLSEEEVKQRDLAAKSKVVTNIKRVISAGWKDDPNFDEKEMSLIVGAKKYKVTVDLQDGPAPSKPSRLCTAIYTRLKEAFWYGHGAPEFDNSPDGEGFTFDQELMTVKVDGWLMQLLLLETRHPTCDFSLKLDDIDNKVVRDKVVFLWDRIDDALWIHSQPGKITAEVSGKDIATETLGAEFKFRMCDGDRWVTINEKSFMLCFRKLIRPKQKSAK